VEQRYRVHALDFTHVSKANKIHATEMLVTLTLEPLNLERVILDGLFAILKSTTLVDTEYGLHISRSYSKFSGLIGRSC